MGKMELNLFKFIQLYNNVGSKNNSFLKRYAHPLSQLKSWSFFCDQQRSLSATRQGEVCHLR